MRIIAPAARPGPDPVEIPPGINLTADEAALWPQFASARAREDWREFDLILLAKLCKIEANIRRYQEILDKSGPIISNKRGTPIDNPLFRVVDTLQRQQLAIIRCLSLAQQGDARTMGARAYASRTFNNALQDDEDVLFARPN
jgi:hypothetical protein